MGKADPGLKQRVEPGIRHILEIGSCVLASERGRIDCFRPYSRTAGSWLGRAISSRTRAPTPDQRWQKCKQGHDSRQHQQCKPHLKGYETAGDVRFGSKADIGASLLDVRFTPKSGQSLNAIA